MFIESSAPTRIDLAGGTLDLWLLSLFHDGARTLDAAISLRAHIDNMLQAARGAGAFGGRVCGAGGGGCLFCVGPPAEIPAIRQALQRAGAQLLDFHIERDGLRIDIRRT